jgi:hypothetical protein
MCIQLCISTSTTETSELEVKQVKSGLEAILGSTQLQFWLALSREMICAQPNTFPHSARCGLASQIFSDWSHGFDLTAEFIVDWAPWNSKCCFDCTLLYLGYIKALSFIHSFHSFIHTSGPCLFNLLAHRTFYLRARTHARTRTHSRTHAGTHTHTRTHTSVVRPFPASE